ncbi:MAG: TonB-dependent receptor domain-containing protein [Mangrovibacterium sp.]
MRTLLIVVLFFAGITGMAQPRGAQGEETGNPPERFVIKGKVVEKESNTVMEYANVSVFNSNDSSLVTGGITDAQGMFRIGNLNPGRFYVEANFIGFKKTRINNIQVTPANRQIDLGIIKLEAVTERINEVEVVAQKPRVEYKVDKKVINISQDIHAAGGTAVDALENAPSVQVDIEGNVSLRGSTSFTVLIDGRPSVLSGSDALQQIPASAIENIEIITNPSARYDPDGMAGIINVVMKKNVQTGINGIINAMIGTNDKQQLDATFNKKTEKVNLTFGFDFNDRNFTGKNYSSRETYDGDTTRYLIKDGERGFSRGGYQLKAGADFYLSDKTTLGFIGNYGYYSFDGGGHANIHQYTDPASRDRYSVERDPSKRDGDYVNGSVNLQHLFNKEGTHKLEALFYYSHRNGDDQDEENEYLADSNYQIIPDGDNLQILTTEDEADNEYRLQADYTRPLGTAGKLEAGFQSRIDRSSEDYLLERYNNATQSWERDDNFSNYQDFERDIHSVYSTVSSKLGPLQYMLGMRGEYTRRQTTLPRTNQSFKLDRFDLFPTAHLSFELPSNYQLMTSYSRRINRPRGRDLDPFWQYMDQYTIRRGNPELEPEYTDSYELGFLKRFGPSFVSLEGFYRITNGLITHISELGDDGILYETTVNLNNDYSLGAELMGDVNPTKWLQINSSVSLYNYRIEDESEGEKIERESTNIDGRINTIFKFSPDSRLQLMGMYRGASISAQGDRKGMLFTNVSYRQDLMKKKLTATVSLADIFGTGKSEGTTMGPNFRSTYKFEREPRILTLTLSYKINNYKNDRSESSREGANEMDFGGENF